MKYGPVFVKDKNGREIVLRSAEVTDAESLIRYLKITAGETPFLTREPEEITFTADQEAAYIRRIMESEKELMLLAFEGGRHVGCCSISGFGSNMRYAHRCQAAIALYREYCGLGIGKIMLETVLKAAADCGFEQAELEVMQKNKGAISLYEKLGFRVYGKMPRNMKYKDGSCDDAYWMMKQL